MPTDPKFRTKLSRLQRIKIQEMMDGCVKCRQVKGLCREHYGLAIDITLDPRRHEYCLRDASKDCGGPHA